MATTAGVPPPNCTDANEELQRIELALLTVFAPPAVAASPAATSHLPAELLWVKQRHLADKYLTNFQASTVSWMVCDRLLSEEPPAALLFNNASQQQHVLASLNQSRRFFAAQTLHTKCKADAHQLPPDARQSLRDSLFHHLTRCAATANGGYDPLTNRIAMCIAALAVQMSWMTVVDDLCKTVITDPSKTKVVSLLLKVLPEECASDRLILADENVRYSMRDHFVATAPNVLQFLHQLSTVPGQSQTDTVANVFKIFHVWVRFVPLDARVILHTPLLEMAIHGLKQADLLEVSADVVVEILRMYPSHHSSNQDLIQRMIPLLSQLPFDTALRSDDEDILRAYCRVIVEMGESYMTLIVSHREDAAQLVEWVTQCSQIKVKEIAQMTLHFWYRMVIDLEGLEPYEYRQDLVDRYTPHLLRLIDICAQSLMRYPEDIITLTDDEYEDIQRDRFYVSETLDDCCRLLGGDVVLHRIGQSLTKSCQEALTLSADEGWFAVESCLSCIICLNRFVPSDEKQVLPHCFDLVSKLPMNIEPLRYTCSKMIGKYASWLAANPIMLQPLLPYLAQALSMAKCASAAATAIKELCRCSNEHIRLAQPVLALYQQFVTASSSSSSGGNRLEPKDELELLEGVCVAISREAKYESSMDVVKSHVHQIVQPIQSSMEAMVVDQRTAPRDVIVQIDRLTAIVMHLKVVPPPASVAGSTGAVAFTNPILEIMQSTWTVLEKVSVRFHADINLAEKICRLHKHAIRACGSLNYVPMLDALLQQISKSYGAGHQSPYLYLASVCIAEYGRMTAYTQRLFDMTCHLSTTTFSFLKSQSDLINHPDIVEELFYMMGRLMSYCPDPLVMSPLLPQLLQCATEGMKLDHQDANRGTLNFVENVVTYALSLRGQSKPQCEAAMHQVLMSQGPSIVQSMSMALVGDIPAYSLERGHGSISGVLWKLNLLLPTQSLQWLQHALAQRSAPASSPSQAAVPDQFRDEFLGAMNSGLPREDFNLSVRAFVSACQRHRKTQGRQ